VRSPRLRPARTPASTGDAHNIVRMSGPRRRAGLANHERGTRTPSCGSSALDAARATASPPPPGAENGRHMRAYEITRREGISAPSRRRLVACMIDRHRNRSALAASPTRWWRARALGLADPASQQRLSQLGCKANEPAGQGLCSSANRQGLVLIRDVSTHVRPSQACRVFSAPTTWDCSAEPRYAALASRQPRTRGMYPSSHAENEHISRGSLLRTHPRCHDSHAG
jgi:hypothetical protein